MDNQQLNPNQAACPCCGYCPQCGRRNAQPYFQPYWNQPYWGWNKPSQTPSIPSGGQWGRTPRDWVEMYRQFTQAKD